MYFERVIELYFERVIELGDVKSLAHTLASPCWHLVGTNKSLHCLVQFSIINREQGDSGALSSSVRSQSKENLKTI